MFHEDIIGNTIGIRSSKGYKAYTDFRFNILAKVNGKVHGYLLEVYPVVYSGDTGTSSL